ncbi:TetR/AcrR family transcriptional regulator C-terminal domain-containing protein [Mycobacteroides immunogenum]|uniref:TetR family transcriptional regulator n=1 Tax=Mycobacteroides immunogenum TaxID=83262 RepID=A0A7V8LKB2_9MYCO|nr:TetR/AcrR family transcriptional regulator C-terminal domain-containing protein [Mycobacteroides immunogenum]AMT69750.1 TetR family transcriptional regulator [Mycobacteroides immunogenum]ANO02800.1 TetR family transcriptional regulator [Mycobacteroides immunogenum]KIU38841.1 TetR family transcriptional regulator [Mycobacteroides immunogenum]KPG03727.1 TetR family transcriptional regulator [Mycobacteroides immunogenum]KPG04160.1 TetR family transcriptional regulator [Mycobacteroides immunoge
MILNRQTIARAGLALLDEKGSDGLTMRALAASLGVQAPALYWHVKNRRELVDLMGEEIFRDALDAVGDTAVPWDTFLINVSRALRQAMLRYHQGARILAGTFVTSAVELVEPMLNAMTAAGFTVREAARFSPVVHHYTIGFTIEQQARDGSEYPGPNPYADENLRAKLDLHRFPAQSEVFAELYQPDFDADFEDGLAIIIDGLRARLRAKGKSADPRAAAPPR